MLQNHNTTMLLMNETVAEYKQEDVLIKDLTCFTTLTKNALSNIGINTVFELSLLSYQDLNRIHLIGKFGRRAILEFCKKQGIILNTESFFRNNK